MGFKTTGGDNPKVTKAQWNEKEKYKLLFNDVKNGLQSSIPRLGLDDVAAKSMAHTLIILVRSCEQELELAPWPHVKQHATNRQLKELKEQGLAGFTVDGENWVLDCKTYFRQFQFPKGFECFAMHTINMTFFRNGELKTEFVNLDHGGDDGEGMDFYSMSENNMDYANFTDRCVQQMSW